MTAKITLVVAMNQQRVIGSNNQLPWHIPEDLAYFKQVTLGKPIIMGRKTFESIGRILPGRKNIIISRSNYTALGAITYSALDVAIADNEAAAEICIIGGGEIFAQALNYANCLKITEVDYPVSNPDAWFPVINFEDWKLVHQQQFTSSNGIKCAIKEYQRNEPSNKE